MKEPRQLYPGIKGLTLQVSTGYQDAASINITNSITTWVEGDIIE